MKTKKFLIAVLTAALVTAFMVSCTIPLEDTSPEVVKVKVKEQPAPDGMVNVWINVGNSKSNARTVMPTTTGYEYLEDFPFFLLFIYDDSSSADVSLTSTAFEGFFEIDAFDNPITLTADNYYTFTVFACNNDADDTTTRYMAWGSSASTLINDDADDTVQIELKEVIDLAGVWSAYNTKGAFHWNPDVSAYETALLTLTPLSTPSTPVPTINELNLKIALNNGKTEALDNGYYIMILELGANDYQTVYVREMVHIWSGFTSVYPTSTTILPTLRSTLCTVNFDYGTDVQTVETRPESKTITIGSTFTDVLAKPTDNTKPAHITDPTNYYFDGWYRESGLSNLLVPSTLVVRDTTLYAKWDAKGTPVSGDFDVSGTFMQYDDDPITAISVTAKVGKTDGIVTVLYNGSSTLPSTYGNYTVTFNVGVGEKYKAETGLSVAGSPLVINQVPTPTKAQFTINNLKQSTKNAPIAVTIEPLGAHTELNTVTNITYTGKGALAGLIITDYTELVEGKYDVTFDTSAVSHIWKAGNQILAGELEIKAPTFWDINVTYSDGPTITFAPYPTSIAILDETLDTLTIHVEADTGHGTYKWYADTDSTTALVSTNAAVNILDIVIPNLSTVNYAWLTPGSRIITLETGDKGTKEFTFTITVAP